MHWENLEQSKHTKAEEYIPLRKLETADYKTLSVRHRETPKIKVKSSGCIYSRKNWRSHSFISFLIKEWTRSWGNFTPKKKKIEAIFKQFGLRGGATESI